MRYADIDEYEVSNGEYNGVSLYVQGCDFHCSGCFNSETWDFDGGKEFTDETCISLLNLLDRPYIKRLSILGGEPLADKNLKPIRDLVEDVWVYYPEKTVWLYTGYTWEQIFYPVVTNEVAKLRQCIVKNVDVLVDGRYIDEQRDLTLKFRGSRNQRVIDVKESLKQGKVILWCN